MVKMVNDATGKATSKYEQIDVHTRQLPTRHLFSQLVN